MDNDEIKIRRYESALNLLFYEGQIAWQLNVVFIALNVGLASLITDPLKRGFGEFNGMLLFYGALGLFINILWLGTFQRNNKYYNFRVAQAREIEPSDWKFLKDRGYRFSLGEEIFIDGDNIRPEHKRHRLSKLGNLVSNKIAIKSVILLIIAVYCLLIFLCCDLIRICG